MGKGQSTDGRPEEDRQSTDSQSMKNRRQTVYQQGTEWSAIGRLSTTDRMLTDGETTVDRSVFPTRRFNLPGLRRSQPARRATGPRPAACRTSAAAPPASKSSELAGCGFPGTRRKTRCWSGSLPKRPWRTEKEQNPIVFLHQRWLNLAKAAMPHLRNGSILVYGDVPTLSWVTP